MKYAETCPEEWSSDVTLNERRRSPRYNVNRYVVSFNQDILAKIVDISNCGISCRCITHNLKLLPTVTKIGLLNCDLGTTVENLACRVVRIFQETGESKTFVNFCLEFENLTSR